MTAGVYNPTVEGGAVFRRTLVVYEPDGESLTNLTGYTANCLLVGDDGTEIDLGVTVGTSLTLGGALGTIVLFINESVTSTITWKNASYILNLVPPSGETERLLKGTFYMDDDE